MDRLVGRADGGARAPVAADMEAIFGAPRPAAPLPVNRSLVIVEAAPRKRWGLVVMAGAVVAAAGGLALEWPSSNRPAPPVPVTAAPVEVTPPASRAPIAVAKPRPVAPSPVVAKPVPVAVQTEAPEPKPAKHTAVATSSAAAIDRRARERYAFDDDTPTRGRCGGLDRYSRHACLLDALENSDRRLRRAYDDAIDAGVSRADLVSRRARWAALRRQAPQRPAYVVAAYDALADEFYTLGARRR